MTVRFQLLILLCFSALFAAAQPVFTGVVKKQDTSAIPVYLAKIEITEGNSPYTFLLLKSYFDGSYKFTPNKSQTYTVHISYPGYCDTTFKVTTNKSGVPTPAQNTVVLKKNGMRLLGVIKGKEDDFPIKEAVISVKNVMTRKEDRVTTGIDGYYNVKLDYETNYRISIDKRSPGIFNKYQDTAFYISTVGFNQPLDYRLDIALAPATEEITPNKDYKPVASEATKPVIEVGVKKDTIAVAVVEKQEEIEAPAEKTEEPEIKHKGKKNKKPEIETVVIRDEEDYTKSELTRKLKQAEKEAREKARQDSIAETKKQLSTTAPAAPVVDSAINETPQQDTTAFAPSVYQKIDSVTEVVADTMPSDTMVIGTVNDTTQRTEVGLSIDTSNVTPEAQPNNVAELETRPATEDSITKALQEIQARQTADSIERANTELQRVAIELANRKNYEDSVAGVLAAIQQKQIDDSIAIVKAEEARIAIEMAEKRAKEDSLMKALEVIRAKQVSDSLEMAKAEQERFAQELAARKLYEDSLAKVLADIRAKKVADSIAAAQAEQARLAAELAAKQAKEDSIAKAWQVIRAQQVADSVARVKAELELKAKQLAAKKAFEDSIAKQLEMVRARFVADSLQRVKTEQERITRELAAKKAYQDSVNRVIQEIKIKAQQDSVLRAKAEEDKRALQAQQAKAYQDSVSKVLAAAYKKYVDDSVARVKVEQERMAKQLADRKAYEDSISHLLTQYQQTLQQPKPRQDSLPASESKPITIEKDKPVAVKTPVTTQPVGAETGTIGFTINSIMLTPANKDRLKQIADKLKQNPTSTLKAYALASAEEPEAVVLSMRRMKAVEDFLIKQNVPATQLITEWFGNSKSLNGCMNPNCPEDLLKQNRAVAYTIVIN